MIGEPFIILPTIDSTNNYAKGLIKDGLARDGMAILAKEQTHGRGQKDRVWESKNGENIMLSAILDTSWLALPDQFQLSCATALACADFFAHYAGDETGIKWPNDLYWRDRKAGGILIENLVKGNKWENAIIGIGININQVDFPSMKNKPVSLKQITGKTFDTELLAKELCQALSQRIQEVKDNQFYQQLEVFNQRLFKLNQLVTLKKNEELITATLIGVNPKGQLIMEGKNEMVFNHGEVEWML